MIDTQRVIQRLSAARSAALEGSWMVVQSECRQVLEAIAKDPQYAGVIQWEHDSLGERIRIHHQTYNTWGFHFRWIEDAFEYLQMLQELGYEWESDEMADNFYKTLEAYNNNLELQAERAEWLEREGM